MKKNNDKKFKFRVPKLTPLNLILMILIPIVLFLAIAIPVIYANEYNENKVTPFASEIENINKKDIVYGNKNTIKDFNFVLYCTDYNNTTGTIKFTGYIYENENTRDIIKPANKVNIKLGMYSDWIKLEKTSSNYSKYIATGPKNAKDNSRSRFDFTISSVPTLPQKGNLPFINIKTIPVYAYVSYVATINGTETTKYYILKYEYNDYVIDAKTLDDTRDKELNVSSTYVQWRYKNDTSWTNSVAIDSLIGIEARVEDNYIQWKRKCDTEWSNLRDITSLSRYEEGKTVEVGVSNGYVRWKYTDDTTWNTLYSTSNTGLTGIDAIKVDDGYIQWKRQNTDWKNLIAVTELPGYTTDAIVDVRLSGGNIQFNFTVKSEEDDKPKTGDWITLQTIESVVGVQVRFDNNNNVQWKCADETEWRNLLDNGQQVTKDNLGTAVKYGPTAGGIE